MTLPYLILGWCLVAMYGFSALWSLFKRGDAGESTRERVWTLVLAATVLVFVLHGVLS